MKYLNAPTKRVMDFLTRDLPVGGHRKVNNSTTFMAVSVDRLSENRYSVAHNYEQNGDLMCDPDMEFYRHISGEWFPVAIQHATGYYVRAVEFADDGTVKGYRVRALADLVSFARTWMRNIREQQSLRLPSVAKVAA